MAGTWLTVVYEAIILYYCILQFLHQGLSLLRSLVMSGASEHKVLLSFSNNNNKKGSMKGDTKLFLGCQQDANLEESQKFEIVT